MKFTLYNNIKLFYNDVFDILMSNETQNMIILGNLIIGHKGEDVFGWRDPASWVMATVSYDDNIHLVALMTPPFGITLYATENTVDEAAVKCLADGLVSTEISIPRVITEKALATVFAEAYSVSKSMKHNISMRQRIYELRAVNPEIPKIGYFRVACEQDLSFLPYWLSDSYATAGIDKPVDSDIDQYRQLMLNGNLYILEDDGIAASAAMIARETPNVAGISFVYTPPYLRGKGYASSVTAQISQLCLDRGMRSCVLYTDLTNPTSNSIYQKIGYVPICDSLEIKFT